MAYHYGRRKLLASYGHWRGLNVMRYLNGSIGPRPAFTPLNIKIAPPYALAPGFTDSFFGAYWVGGVSKVVLLMTSGDVFQSDDPSGTPGWNYIGNLGFVPTCACVNGVGVQVGSVDIVSSGNPDIAAGAFIDPISMAIAPITGQPVCDLMVAFGVFIVVGLDRTYAPTLPASSLIWFSDLPGDLNTVPGQSWTGAQGDGVGVVGVGDFQPVSGLFTQKDTLVIAKQAGEWWSLTGIPTSPPVIRRIDVGLEYKGVGGSVRQSNIWFPNGRDIGTFTGSLVAVSDLPDLGDFGGNSIYQYGTFDGLSQLEQTDEFILTATGTSYTGQLFPWAFIHHGMAGAGTSPGWSRHLLPYLGRTINPGSNIPLFVGDSVTWLFLQVAPNEPIDVFQFDIRQEIPYQEYNATFPAGNPAAIYADMGQAGIVSGTFQIPEWWAPDGQNAHVTEVFVDLDFDAAAWQNAKNAGINPAEIVGFSMYVEALNLKGADASRASRTLSWTPADKSRPVPKSNTSMLRTRASFRIGDQGLSSGFRINLTQMRGIQMWRILAMVDIDASEP